MAKPETLYPSAPAGTAAEKPSKAEIDAIKAKMLDLLMNGKPADYDLAGYETGDLLPEEHVRGLSLAGKDYPVTCKQMFDDIQNERKALHSVSPTNFDKQTDYTNALAAEAKDLDPVKWYTEEKKVWGCSTWAEVKEMFPTPPPPPPPAEQRAVDDIGIPTQASDILIANGIETVGDLEQKTEAELLALDGLGPSYLENIKDALASLGKSLKAE